MLDPSHPDTNYLILSYLSVLEVVKKAVAAECLPAPPKHAAPRANMGNCASSRQGKSEADAKGKPRLEKTPGSTTTFDADVPLTDKFAEWKKEESSAAELFNSCLSVVLPIVKEEVVIRDDYGLWTASTLRFSSEILLPADEVAG